MQCSSEIALLTIFSDFLDEIEDLSRDNCSSVSNDDSTGLRRKRSENSSPHLLTSLWLGIGQYGASCNASSSDDDDDDKELLLCAVDEDDEARTTRKMCAKVRHNMMDDMSGFVVETTRTAGQLNIIHVPHIQLQRSLLALARSQTTRERTIYTLRTLIPQGPLLVVQHVRELLSSLHLTCAQENTTVGEAINDFHSFVDILLVEILSSPSRVISKCFSLFECCAECVLLALWTTLLRCVAPIIANPKVKLNDSYDETIQVIDTVANAVEVARSRLIMLIVCSSGSETHWMFISSLITNALVAATNIHDDGHQLEGQSSRDAFLSREFNIMYEEALRALQVWVHEVSPSFFMSTLRKQIRPLIESHLQSLRSLPNNADRVASLGDLIALVGEANNTPLEVLLNADMDHEESVLHAIQSRPLNVLWKSPQSLLDDGPSMNEQFVYTTLSLFEGWRSAPVRFPEWMSSHAGTHFASLFSVAGWRSASLFGSCEFHLWLPECGRRLAETLVRTQVSLLTQSSYEVLHHETFFRFVCGAAANSHETKQQLSEPLRSRFEQALGACIVGDPRATGSPAVFEENAYDIVLRFLNEVLPLKWELESSVRLRKFFSVARETLTLGEEHRVAVSRLGRLVGCAASWCVVEGLCERREAHVDLLRQDVSSDEVTCFSSDDVTILRGFLDVLVEFVSSPWVDEESEHGGDGGLSHTIAFRDVFLGLLAATTNELLLPDSTTALSLHSSRRNNALVAVVSSDSEMHQVVGESIGRWLHSLLHTSSRQWNVERIFHAVVLLRCLVSPEHSDGGVGVFVLNEVSRQGLKRCLRCDSLKPLNIVELKALFHVPVVDAARSIEDLISAESRMTLLNEFLSLWARFGSWLSL